MTPRTSLLRTPAHIVPVLGAVALICGLVAGANLGIDGRQNLLLAAGAIACSVLAIAPGRSIPIRLTIATFSLLAAALVWIGIDLLASDSNVLVGSTWALMVVGAITLSTGRGRPSHPPAIAVATALVVILSIGLQVQLDQTRPTWVVQLAASIVALLTITLAVELIHGRRTLGTPLVALSLAIAVGSGLAATLEDRIWTTISLTLLIGACLVRYLLDRPGLDPGYHDTGTSSNPVHQIASTIAVAGGAAVVVASAIAGTPFGWPVAGAAAAGVIGLAIGAVDDARAIRSQQNALRNQARESRIDALTGVLNRRGIDERLDDEVTRARRYGHPLSMLVIDIDDFKLVNDRFGHAAGDSALVAVASTINAAVRSIDVVGRLGGEEFLVILPETAIDGAAVVANRILRDVAGVDLPSSSLTVSIGAAELREPGSQHDLVEQADAALYTAKRAGKNRVELFG